MSPNTILANNCAISEAVPVEIEDLSDSDADEDDGDPNAQVVLHPLKCPISPASLVHFKGRFSCFVYLNHDSNEVMSLIFFEALRYCNELLDNEMPAADPAV